MKPVKWQADQVAAQISELLLAYPELDEDEILRADMFLAETNLHDTLSHIERARQAAVHSREMLRLYIDEINVRAARFDRRDEALRAVIFKLLQVANLQKIELPEATLSIRAGTVKTIITDETLLPDDLVRIKREPDKPRIKAILMANGIVPGAELSNATPVLSIRTK